MTFERKQWQLIAAAGLVFALIFGVRQAQVLFIGPTLCDLQTEVDSGKLTAAQA